MKPDFYIHEDIILRIIGDHPHAGELCNPIGESPETVTKHSLLGEPTYQVALINCPHLIEGCFVAHKSLELIDAPKSKRINSPPAKHAARQAGRDPRDE